MTTLKLVITSLVIFAPSYFYAQTNWTSTKYNYSIEIPNGFTKTTAIGPNVDFKANKGISSIVIVVKTFPSEYKNYTILDVIGDQESYVKEWQTGAKEYLINPIYIKHGTTILSKLDCFWLDYTTDNPKLYSKIYQVKKGCILYTITLTCPKEEINNFQAIWYRFKESVSIK